MVDVTRIVEWLEHVWKARLMSNMPGIHVRPIQMLFSFCFRRDVLIRAYLARQLTWTVLKSVSKTKCPVR